MAGGNVVEIKDIIEEHPGAWQVARHPALVPHIKTD
jgi:hypothetical protein